MKESKRSAQQATVAEAPKLCANCNTERYGIWCRGYCYRCYRLTVQKEEVERWDLKKPSTFPGIGGYSQRRFEEEFPKIKADRLRELEYRLWLLKTKEARRTGKISGIDIEYALRDLAKCCGADENVVHGIASIANHYFDQRARRTLLGWLFDIEESMRWDPRRYWRALHPEEVKRMIAQARADSRLKTVPQPTRRRHPR